jgi:hypothetical protein
MKLSFTAEIVDVARVRNGNACKGKIIASKRLRLETG